LINSIWQFEHDSTLNYLDIRLLVAQNYFLLEDFINSLKYTQMLNPDFNCNISTNEGVMELSAEIERLYSII